MMRPSLVVQYLLPSLLETTRVMSHLFKEQGLEPKKKKSDRKKIPNVEKEAKSGIKKVNKCNPVQPGT